MKKRFSLFVFILTTLVSVFVISGCDINNPIIDGWWEGSPDTGNRYPFMQETYVVSFDLDGGKYVDSINGDSPSASPQRVLAHAHASVPGLVAKDGGYFSGWYKNAACNDDWVFDTDEANSANDSLDGKEDDIITLYAGWKTSGHKVDFDINFPESGFDAKANLTYVPLQESIADGAFAAEPLQFGLKEGTSYFTTYVFTGWYTTGDTKWDFAAMQVTADITLHAGWAENLMAYTVKFDSKANINPPPTQRVMSGGPVIAPYVTYRNGYAFGGWYKDETCTDDWDFANDTVTKNITLYAKWAPVAEVDILKDVNIVDFRYILFSGGQTIFNDPAAQGSSTNLTADEKATNTDEIKKIASYLDKYHNYQVMVVGHANPTTAADKANPQNAELMALSQGRADAVKAQIEAALGTLGSQYDLNKTPIQARAEGGRRAMQEPMLSRRVEVIVFDITTEAITP